MKDRTTNSIFFIFVCIFSPAFLYAQDKTTVQVSADRTSILIGEPILLKLEADIPQNRPIRFFHLDSLPHFEYLAQEKIDTVNTSGGTELSQIIRITSFDSGRWTIPPFIFHDDILTDSIVVDVGFSTFNPEQPYHDIKNIVEVEPEEENKKTNWVLILAGAVLLITLILWVLRRKKPQPQVLPEAPAPDPYKEAMEELNRLKKEKLDTRQYYSKLVDIFRVYLSAKKGIHSLQETTADLVRQLQALSLAGGVLDRLSHSLRLSDFVKFAKYDPTEADDKDTFDNIRESIDHIEQL